MKTVKCDLFGKGEYIYFNIGRLSRLESELGKTIVTILNGNIGITETIAAYKIGLSHIDKKRTTVWYEEKMQALLDEGVTLDALMMPALKAIIGSGIGGKTEYFDSFPDEMTEKDKKELEVEAKLDGKNA